MQIISEIMKCFIGNELNAAKTMKYLNEEKKYQVSKHLILRVYKEMREVIYQYYLIQYKTETLRNENNHSEYYSIDESIFGHKSNKQIWMLGAINTITKDFRIEGVLFRDAETLNNLLQL